MHCRRVVAVGVSRRYASVAAKQRRLPSKSCECPCSLNQKYTANRLTGDSSLSSCYRRAVARCQLNDEEDEIMTTNKALLALAMGLALAACTNKQQAADSAADASTAATEAQQAADNTAATGDTAAADAAQASADAAAAASNAASTSADAANTAGTMAKADDAADAANDAADAAKQAQNAAEQAAASADAKTNNDATPEKK